VTLRPRKPTLSFPNAVGMETGIEIPGNWMLQSSPIDLARGGWMIGTPGMTGDAASDAEALSRDPRHRVSWKLLAPPFTFPTSQANCLVAE
jgi:hypothetical protein